METFLNNQLGLFFMYVAGGIIICLIFDIFRALRKSVKTTDLVTYIEDSIFWIIVAVFLIYLIFILNSGNIRLYSFAGLILGGVLYYFTISKYFMKISVCIFTLIKKVLLKIFWVLLMPIRFLFKINKKIVCFICINLQNMTNIFKKFPKLTKNKKKAVK